MDRLSPCPSCRRHVNVNEEICPFCARDLDFSELPPLVRPRERLSRAAALSFGAGLVSALSGACGGATDADPSEGTGGANSAATGGTRATGGTPGTGGVWVATGGAYGAPPLGRGGAPATGGTPTTHDGGDTAGGNPGGAGGSGGA